MSNSKILTVKVGASIYAVEVIWIKEILTVTKLSPSITPSHFVRGNQMVRGVPIPLIDLRKYFAQPALIDERKQICDILEKRQQDHVDWLDELVRCVEQNDVFKKALDPAQCAFGKWLSSFKPESLDIERQLHAFDLPHRDIHAIATEVLTLVENGERNKALRRLEEARQFELQRVLKVFEQVRNYFITNIRETAVVVGKDSTYCGLIVDSVIDIKSRSAFSEAEFKTTGIHKGISLSLTDNSEPVHVLNIADIMGEVHMTASRSQLVEQIAGSL